MIVLRKVAEKKEKSNDLDKCCRWCHFYKSGECHNKDVVKNNAVDFELGVYSVVEEGYLDETLEETLGSVNYKEFEDLTTLLLSWGISQKRIKLFEDTFKKNMEDFSFNLKERLSDNVHDCYLKHLDLGDVSLTINDPENYCCDKWR